MEDKELVSITLNGLATFWRPFVQGVCALENMSSLCSFRMISCKRRLGWSLVLCSKGKLQEFPLSRR